MISKKGIAPLEQEFPAEDTKGDEMIEGWDQDVIQILKETCRIFHQTLLLVTHDLQIARMADVVLTLEDGVLFKGEDILS